MANNLLQSLDARTQKLLSGGAVGSQFGSQKSLKDASFQSNVDVTDDRGRLGSSNSKFKSFSIHKLK